MSETKNVAILGASGYTGAEAIRLISGHPRLSIKALTGYSRAGQSLADTYPNFAPLGLPDIVILQDVNWDEIDVAFACLPHGASQDTIAQIINKVETVIDLSADFRLRNPILYEDTYGRSHDHGDLLSSAVYGLTEYAREELNEAKLVACPGCYPTCSLLSLLPAIEADLIDVNNIIIDAKSGVTGAGRKEKTNLLYSELSDGAHAYGVGNHRHAPEIDQMIALLAKDAGPVTFTPHLIPMNRGMITTSYVSLRSGINIKDLRSVYQSKYLNDPFVHVEAEGVVPQTRHVRGSNYCRIALFEDRVSQRAIIISVIDNLTKGSSGQALQNYNLTQGWDETMGLEGSALFP